MNALHSLLKRQLRRFANETIPIVEAYPGFLGVINDAYWQFDADRRMLEQSLELTSQELLERNTELNRINSELEMRVAARTAELSSSEARFRGLFEHVPVSLWEEDYSAVRQHIDLLRDAGVTDFSTYFDSHPQAVAVCATKVKIVDVNHATLEMYRAESKAQLLTNLSKILEPESLSSFKEELIALTRGALAFENETINYTLTGERRVISLRLNVAPGYEETWAKVFVGISDITEHRQAEAALAAERDLLQALMDNIPDTIYFKDTASRFTRINRAQTRVLGLTTAKEAIGKTDLDFFQEPHLAQGFFEEEQRIVETGEALIDRVEFNPTPDGKPRWFSATKVPIKNGAGEVIGLVGISRDITKDKLIEETLRLSEERFRLMAWATTDAVWDRDLQTNQIWWASGLQKFFHYSSGTILTDIAWWHAHIHPEDQAKVDRTINQALTGGLEFWSKEYRFQRVDGTYANIMDRGYILRNAGGEPYRMIGAMMDITDRKQAEQALLESEARYRQIVETAGDIIYRVNLEGRLSYANPTALRLMGYRSEADILDRSYLEFVHPAWRERVRFTYNRQFSEGILNTYFEFLAVTRERREIWLGQTVQLVTEDNRVIGFQVVARDITAQKEAEEALHEANHKMGIFLDELQQRNHETALLNEMGRSLQACQSAEEAYRIIADLTSQMFPYTAGAVYQLNPARTLVSPMVSWGELPSANQAFAPDDCWALRRGQTYLLSENQEPRCLHLAEPLPAATFCLPMQVQGEVLGVLHVQSTSQENLSESKRQLAYTVVEQAAMALSNLKLRDALREQSIRDPLTGLYNRRYMEEVLKQQLSRVTRHLHPLGIIMIDIDHFKRFNDTYGHAAGDALLRELARFLQSHIRIEDIACRYGGEEFILIMPDASLTAAQERAEYLRSEASQLRLREANPTHEGVTLSLGVAIYPQHGRAREIVLRAADEALYRAKQAGRNQVVVAESVF